MAGYISIPEDEMLRRLRLTLARKGKLSDGIIRNTAGLPSTQCYVKHFGSIRKAYALIGYKASRDCAWYDARQHWSDVLSKLAARIAEALRADLGLQVHLREDGPSLALDGTGNIISFRVARQPPRKSASRTSQWRAHLRKMRSELFIVPRLNDANNLIQDYVIVPKPEGAKPYLTLSDASLAHHGAVAVSPRHRGRGDCRDQSAVHFAQPCRASQANATEQANETRPAQNQERPRAALMERR